MWPLNNALCTFITHKPFPQNNLARKDVALLLKSSISSEIELTLVCVTVGPPRSSVHTLGCQPLP